MRPKIITARTRHSVISGQTYSNCTVLLNSSTNECFISDKAPTNKICRRAPLACLWPKAPTRFRPKSRQWRTAADLVRRRFIALFLQSFRDHFVYIHVLNRKLQRLKNTESKM